MKRICFILTALVALAGCKDFFETDLANKTVNIVSPADNATTTTATVNFYWEKLDGARTYHIQIAKPSFPDLNTLVTDTSVSGTGFSFVLVPGNYQWRIRAENGSSQTAYITRSITIDSTADLSSQTLILKTPVNDYATAATTVTFSCYGLYNATGYRWALKTHSSGFSGTLVLPEQLSSDTAITVSGLTEGYYDWGMRAEASTTSTLYASRSIYIDLTAPDAPTLTSPADASTSTAPNFTLSWSNATDSGSPLYDSVYIYSNSSLTTIKRTYKITSGSSLSDTLTAGTYYWRVKTIDKAGNNGPFSSSRWFKLM